MIIDKSVVKRIARKAYLKFSSEEESQIQENLSNMLYLIADLAELDIAKITELNHISDEVPITSNDLNPKPFSKADVLIDAPANNSIFFPNLNNS